MGKCLAAWSGPFGNVCLRLALLGGGYSGPHSGAGRRSENPRLKFTHDIRKYEFRIPMRDGAKLFNGNLCAEGRVAGQALIRF